jgi:hypothetical protein
MRFFRAATDEVYEQARATLDAAWGLPNDKGTVTCISPIATAPRGSDGRPMVAVSDEWCEWPPADALLPQLIAGGAVAEISEADYKANWPEA